MWWAETCSIAPLMRVTSSGIFIMFGSFGVAFRSISVTSVGGLFTAVKKMEMRPFFNTWGKKYICHPAAPPPSNPSTLCLSYSCWLQYVDAFSMLPCGAYLRLSLPLKMVLVLKDMNGRWIALSQPNQDMKEASYQRASYFELVVAKQRANKRNPPFLETTQSSTPVAGTAPKYWYPPARKTQQNTKQTWKLWHI